MSTFILGAGVTGLAAGCVSGFPIFEAEDISGGICLSYYVRPGSNKRLPRIPKDKEAYRFTIGGGHWIFGACNDTLSFIRKFTHLKNYIRHSSIYFSKENLIVPYPIQNNLRFLDKEISKKILKEISNLSCDSHPTMKQWLLGNFGSTLCKLFFYPFHDLYTTNLYEKIAPQDTHKSPVDTKLTIQGVKSDTPSVGYNANFVYPKEGLDTLVRCMAKKCNIHYGKRVTRIDVKEKKVYFADGSIIPYSWLISTLPLNKMMEMTGLNVDAETDPYTSVSVLNIGAIRADGCPDQHWLYTPHSKSGFHRIGFYSNIDVSFLPRSSQKSNNRVSIYTERAYPGGQKPSEEEIEVYSDAVVNELRKLGFIKDVEIIDHTWVEVAYTWSWLGSKWKKEALIALEKHNIRQLGRYARWKFQGITDSIKDGLCWKMRKNEYDQAKS